MSKKISQGRFSVKTLDGKLFQAALLSLNSTCFMLLHPFKTLRGHGVSISKKIIKWRVFLFNPHKNGPLAAPM
jgi:hypothetical protein